MNILVNTSTRLSYARGMYWSPSESYARGYWRRFLDVFDTVLLLARVFPAPEPSRSSQPVAGDGITIVPLPDYYGMGQFAAKYLALRRIVKSTLCQAEAICLSQPCVIGDVVWNLLEKGRPFGVAVCGDPHDVFAPEVSRHPLRPAMRWWFSRRLRLQCGRACACTYVTRRVLQARYPAHRDAYSTYYSSINLPSEAILDTRLTSSRKCEPFRIVNVATFESWYKGVDTLVEASALCLRNGLDFTLTLIGDGRHRLQVERLVEKTGIRDRVRFTGHLACTEALRAELDTADLFVLASRTEGLPKALIEAMARGLPCIGTAVGGIPELLPKEDLVPPNDPKTLSLRIAEVAKKTDRRVKMSARNVAVAKEYRANVLRERRIGFYRALKSRSAEWLMARSFAETVAKDCS